MVSEKSRETDDHAMVESREIGNLQATRDAADGPNVAVSIITVTFNSSSDLRRSYAKFEHGDIEWIVVDNDSADDSVDVAQRLGARVVTLPTNVGFAKANNIGASVANGNVLLFANPDVTPEAVGVRSLADAARREGGIHAPQLLNDDQSLQENGRGTPFPHRKVLHYVRRNTRQHDPYLLFAAEGETVDCVWATGAALAIKTTEFAEIGGWDERFFMYYEDSDICLRARYRGWPVRVHGDVRWHHGWRRAIRRGWNLWAWRQELRSAAIFYWTHKYCILPVGRRSKELRRLEQNRGLV